MIRIELLTEKNFNVHSLDDYSRKHEVKRVWRRVNGEYALVDMPYTEDWDADPECKVRGVGTALLSALERDEKGKLVYLYTDDGCTYQFYEHRGFVREEERNIVMELNEKTVPLTCMIYAKRL